MTFIFLLNFRPAPENEDEMMEAIFEYIDRIFNIVVLVNSFTWPLMEW